MATQIAPPKVTGGGGFEFEDKLAAFYLCYLLADRPPLNSSFGTIKRIDFQTRVVGWFLDDLLLTIKNSSEERKCAFSVKSNIQFSKTSAPKDFVRLAWEQFLCEGSTSFNKEKDRIGLITSPQDSETKKHIETLLNMARGYYRGELWCKLLGMHYLIKPFWTEDKKFIIKEIKDYYGKWALCNLTVSDNAVEFIHFLRCPAAEEILSSGIILLDKASEATGGRFFSNSDNKIQKYLPELLEISLKKHKNNLLKNEAAYKSFKNLLRKLVDLQNLQAIEIQQSLL